MSLDHCLELLRAGDPDRFATLLASPPAVRPPLATLYAVNLEIARAPWNATEPMLAEMRLQWWADRLAGIAQGGDGGAHPVLAAFAGEWPEGAPLLLDLIEARRREAQREPVPDLGELQDFIDRTAGHLMWIAASRLGAGSEAEPVVRARAMGAGLAAWLSVLPRLQAGGVGLADPDAGFVAEAARSGLSALDLAAAGRSRIARSADPALFTGFSARPLLRAVSADPSGTILQGVDISLFSRRWRLAWLAAAGRW